jgi:hypothetical protein
MLARRPALRQKIYTGGRRRKRSICGFCGQSFSAVLIRQHLSPCRQEKLRKLVGQFIPLLYGELGTKFKLIDVNRQAIFLQPMSPADTTTPLRIPIQDVLKISSRAMREAVGYQPKLIISTKLKAKWLGPLKPFLNKLRKSAS